MPFRNISVSFSLSEVKHDDRAFTVNIITFSQISELLLTCSVPNIESNWTVGGLKIDWSHVSSFGRNIRFLEVTCHMSFGEGCFADSSVSNQNQFKRWYVLLLV